MSGHADETDDHHLYSMTHPGTSIVPSALAVAEQVNASGLEFLRAVVLGYDFCTRFAFAMSPILFFERHRSIHSYAGAFGSCAAAASLLRLNPAQIRQALSYVAQQTSGLRSWARDPEHIEKAFVLGGMPARNGVAAAIMVHAGFTGVDDVLSGEHNLFDALCPEGNPDLLVDRLGEYYEIMRASIKKWCVGGPIQAPADGVSELLKQGINCDNLTRLDVRLAAKEASIVDNKSIGTICVQHQLALLLVDGDLTFESSHDEARVSDPRVLRQREKINLIYDTPMEQYLPRRPVNVTAMLSDGSQKKFEAKAVRGTADNPMRTEEVEDKARQLISPVTGEATCVAIIEEVRRLDSVASISQLSRKMAVSN